jgi:hypothetical protein
VPQAKRRPLLAPRYSEAQADSNRSSMPADAGGAAWPFSRSRKRADTLGSRSTRSACPRLCAATKGVRSGITSRGDAARRSIGSPHGLGLEFCLGKSQDPSLRALEQTVTLRVLRRLGTFPERRLEARSPTFCRRRRCKSGCPPLLKGRSETESWRQSRQHPRTAACRRNEGFGRSLSRGGPGSRGPPSLPERSR